MVYLPSFTLSEAIGLHPNFVFSLICYFFVFTLFLLVLQISTKLKPNSEDCFTINVVSVAVVSLSVLMNGRLVLAFCGYLLIILIGFDWFKSGRWRMWHLAGLIVGCFLAGVSSGTILAAMAVVGGISILTLWHVRGEMPKAVPVYLSCALTIALFSTPALIGLAKNLTYFGGDALAVFRMMDHGLGGLALQSAITPAEDEALDAVGNNYLWIANALLPYWWVGVLCVGLIARLRGWEPIQVIRSSTPAEHVVQLAVGVALLGGLYGYSVLVLAILPSLILLLPRLRRSASSVSNRVCKAQRLGVRTLPG